MNKTILPLGVIAVFLLGLPLAVADQEKPGAAVSNVDTIETAESKDKVILESRYLPDVDVDKQDGGLSIGETQFSFEHDFKVKERLPVTFTLSAKHIDINSDVATYLPSTLVGRSLGLGTKFPAPFTASPNYFIGVDVFAQMYTDGWDETSSSAFRMPFRTYLIYRRDENFIVFGGLSIRPSFDSHVLPIAGFIYKPTPELAFNIASDNPTITYQVTPKTKLLLEGDFINDEYEVQHLGEKGRVLFYRELSAGTGVEHAFTDSIKGLVTVGTVFSRQLKYEDDTGKVQPDAGVYFKGRVTVNF
jgi:hypothetical protein